MGGGGGEGVNVCNMIKEKKNILVIFVSRFRGNKTLKVIFVMTLKL